MVKKGSNEVIYDPDPPQSFFLLIVCCLFVAGLDYIVLFLLIVCLFLIHCLCIFYPLFPPFQSLHALKSFYHLHCTVKFDCQTLILILIFIPVNIFELHSSFGALKERCVLLASIFALLLFNLFQI